MPKQYRTIVFDCVNTVLLPDFSRLPTIELEGKAVRSTVPALLDTLAPRYPHLEAEAVHHAFRRAWRWAESERGPDLQEVPAPNRFRRFLVEMDLPEPGVGLADDLLAAHMKAVTDTLLLPAAHKALLRALKSSHALALFSNFDHRPALLARLRAAGIADWFDPLIISDGLGFRKPGAEAFSRALSLLGGNSAALLMVGDSLEDDVAGCRKAGIDVAWFNPKGDTAPEHNRPTYQLSALEEVAQVVGV